eukprot:365810-Chlamydomonas_euryale.AAC.25
MLQLRTLHLVCKCWLQKPTPCGLPDSCTLGCPWWNQRLASGNTNDGWWFDGTLAVVIKAQAWTTGYPVNG